VPGGGLPNKSSNVTGIEPGLTWHDRSALMSPIVSLEPRVSTQIAGFLVE
jgi:hypothetical protein